MGLHRSREWTRTQPAGHGRHTQKTYGLFYRPGQTVPLEE